MAEKMHPYIAQLIPFVDGIAKTLGQHCEVVLHDFSRLPDSVVAIANGHVTGRTVGSPQTEHSLNVIKTMNNYQDLINYSGKSVDGKVLKSSSFFIKNDEGEAIGVFCINIDLTAMKASSKVLEEIMKIDTNVSNKGYSDENKVNQILNEIIDETLKNASGPVAYLSKEDKVRIVRELNKKGVFLVKGAIDYVAEILCVSRYTIYNYLDEIKED